MRWREYIEWARTLYVQRKPFGASALIATSAVGITSTILVASTDVAAMPLPPGVAPKVSWDEWQVIAILATFGSAAAWGVWKLVQYIFTQNEKMGTAFIAALDRRDERVEATTEKLAGAINGLSATITDKHQELISALMRSEVTAASALALMMKDGPINPEELRRVVSDEIRAARR